MDEIRRVIKQKLASEKIGIVSFAKTINIRAVDLSDYLFRGRILQDKDKKKIIDYLKTSDSKLKNCLDRK